VTDSLDLVQATATKINAIGARFMLHEDALPMLQDAGYSHPFEFYVCGRGGVLGDVDADVVASAFGFFGPGLIRRFWESGSKVLPAREAGRLFAQSAQQWGRKHIHGVDGLARVSELGEKVIAAADTSALALFAGWKTEPLPDDDAGRAYQVLHVLREHRGSAHLVGVLAAGLTPFQAAASKLGERAKSFGWRDELGDVNGLVDRLATAERLTDELTAPAYAALEDDEAEEFEALVDAIHTVAVPAPAPE
jgi:hypothetical protein